MVAKQESTPRDIIWTDAVAAKRAIRDGHIDKYHNRSQYSSSVVQVTELDDIGILLGLLEKGEISAEAVINAYIDKYVVSA